MLLEMVLGFEGAGEAFLGASDTLDALLVRPSRARSLLNIIIPLPEVRSEVYLGLFLERFALARCLPNAGSSDRREFAIL